MTHKLLVMMLVGVGLLNITNARAQSANDKGAAVVVTGCLAQGEQPTVFTIQDSAGKTFLLMSSSVNMKPHLGHQVTITAVPMKAGAHDKEETKTAQHD